MKSSRSNALNKARDVLRGLTFKDHAVTAALEAIDRELDESQPNESQDAERWRTFISLPYEIRADWAVNASLVPVFRDWVDQAAINAKQLNRSQQ